VESSPASSKKDQKRLEAEQRQSRSRERKAQQQVVHRLEKEIQELEARQAEIVAELEKARDLRQARPRPGDQPGTGGRSAPPRRAESRVGTASHPPGGVPTTLPSLS
jgi:septal ring factor EnvC (AmiA/AmiB activator)